MSPENKQRIIGAVVLVAFIALLIPFLFASGIKKKLSSADEIPINAQKRQLITQQIQSINNTAATPPPVTAEQPVNNEQLQELPQDQQVEQADIALPPPENNQTVAATETALTNTSDAVMQDDEITSAAPVKLTLKDKAIKKSKATPKTNARNLWSVQVGSFSDDAHVQKLLTQLHSSGFHVYTQKIATATGSLTRVLVGHKASKEQASQTAKKLAATMKIKGRLVRVQK